MCNCHLLASSSNLQIKIYNAGSWNEENFEFLLSLDIIVFFFPLN